MGSATFCDVIGGFETGGVALVVEDGGFFMVVLVFALGVFCFGVLGCLSGVCVGCVTGWSGGGDPALRDLAVDRGVGAGEPWKLWIPGGSGWFLYPPVESLPFAPCNIEWLNFWLNDWIFHIPIFFLVIFGSLI